MFRIQSILLIILTFTGSFVLSQDSTSLETFPLKSREYKPAVGIGYGYFSFLGDVHNSFDHSPLSGSQAVMLELSRGISNPLDVSLKVTRGNIVGSDNYHNFRSSIFIGEALLNYNFHPIIPHTARFHPFVGIGFESFEFNPKGDLLDANGNPYHFWSDGSVRTLAQDDENATQAELLTRDYVYETDLRELNLDSLGKYPLVSMGIPLTAGMNFELGDRVRFKVNTTYHLVFTDNVDNISDAGTGVRQGNSHNDNFFFTSFSLHYDFLIPPKEVSDEFEFPDYFAFDGDDFDGDGVIDFLDSCAMTPEGVAVLGNGCPLDTDEDGVPDYKDHEIYSSEDAYVDIHGVALTDADFQQWYLAYMDSLEIPIEVLTRMTGKPKPTGVYRVRVDRLGDRIPENQVDLYLAIDDLIALPVIDDFDSIDYVTKRYGPLQEAKLRRDSLIADGLVNSEVVVEFNKRIYSLAEYQAIQDLLKQEDSLNYANKLAEMEGKFVRVLGSTPVDANSFEKAQYYPDTNTVVITGDENESIYINGVYDDVLSAEKAKNRVLGTFADAQIRKYQNGELIDVTEQLEQAKDTMHYAVKVAEFGDDVPADVTNKVLSIPDISSTTTDNPRKTVYTSGDFDNIADAKERLNELKEMGFESSVVVVKKGDQFEDVPNEEVFTPEELANMQKQDAPKSIEESTISTKAIVFRVQLGAYRNSVSKAIFKGVDVIEFPSKQGITKYVTGSFDTYKQAHEHKQKMHDKGFADAFVVGYKNGERVHITELIKPDEYKYFKDANGQGLINQADTVLNPNVSYSKALVEVNVQVGIVKGEMTDVQKQPYKDLREVQFVTNGGFTKILAGKFSDQQSAIKYRELLISQGFEGAFLIASYNKEPIPVKKAFLILNQE